MTSSDDDTISIRVSNVQVLVCASTKIYDWNRKLRRKYNRILIVQSQKRTGVL